MTTKEKIIRLMLKEQLSLMDLEMEILFNNYTDFERDELGIFDYLDK